MIQWEVRMTVDVEQEMLGDVVGGVVIGWIAEIAVGMMNV